MSTNSDKRKKLNYGLIVFICVALALLAVIVIGKLTSDGKLQAEYTLPRQANNPNNLFVGPDNNLWFTEDGPNGTYIGRITPTGALTEFHEGYGDFSYTSLAFYRSDLWFAVSFLGQPTKLGRMPVPLQ